jgi:hypothetical protein
MGIEHTAPALLLFRIMALRARMTAARGFCVKTTAIAANASQCGRRFSQSTSTTFDIYHIRPTLPRRSQI